MRSEATSCLHAGGGSRGFGPRLAEEDTERRGFRQLPGLQPRDAVWSRAPRPNWLFLAASFSEARLSGRLGVQMGLGDACLSPKHAGWLRGPPPGWGCSGWPGHLASSLPLRPWHPGRSSEPRVLGGWQVCGCERDREASHVAQLHPRFGGRLWGSAGGLLAGSRRADTFRVAKLNPRLQRGL